MCETTQQFTWPAPSPPALLASVALLTVVRIVRPGRRLLAVLGCLVLGSVLFFGPIPESHILGGASLLLEGTAVFWVLLARSRELDDTRTAAVAVLWCFVAIGVTLTNALPGLLLLMPLWQIQAGRSVLLRRLGMAALTILILEVMVVLFQIRYPDVEGHNNLAMEMNWLIWPTWDSFRESFSSLFLRLFGLPLVCRTPHIMSSGDGPPYLIIYPQPKLSFLQCAAAACWCAGLRLGWKHATIISRILTTNCFIALLGLVSFSAFYDTYESYMVSAHVWPLLLLPTLLFLREAPSLRSLPSALIVASIFLCAFQSYRALPHAYYLLTHF